eukprot:TRINITY_DN6736_c0_g1_i1.p1 TRINITY_DN6736_c0_g1~~TRINITY_DN6736_c0_g1_i1.p1  ORF type:complete len:863 (-),score=163.01 TRINITY_DN6736_c0_g1_i1:432-3020(-)
MRSAPGRVQRMGSTAAAYSESRLSLTQTSSSPTTSPPPITNTTITRNTTTAQTPNAGGVEAKSVDAKSREAAGVEAGKGRGRVRERRKAAFVGGGASAGVQDTSDGVNAGIDSGANGIDAASLCVRLGRRFMPDAERTSDLDLQPPSPFAVAAAGALVASAVLVAAAWAMHAVALAALASHVRSPLVAALVAAVAVAVAAVVARYASHRDPLTFIAHLHAILLPAAPALVLVAHPFLALWSLPSVLITTLYAEGNRDFYILLHVLGVVASTIVAHAETLKHQAPLMDDNDVFEIYITCSVVFIVMIVIVCIRFIFHQIAAQQESIEDMNLRLQVHNRILQSEIRVMQGVHTEEVLGTPAEKVINMLRAILGDPKAGLSEHQIADINQIIRLVGSNKLYVSSVSYSAIKPSENVDTETQKWVLDQLVQQDIEEPVSPAPLLKADSKTSTDPSSPFLHRGSSSGLLLSATRSEKRLSMDMRKPSVFRLNIDNMSKALVDVLNISDSWNFDVFELERLSGGQALPCLGFHVFEQQGLLAEFDIPEETMKRFLSKMQAGYLRNPYHNSLHAGDVLQTYNSLLTSGGFGRFLESPERFGCLLAAIIHDFRHPGVNNNFLMSIEDPIAITFNDSSVLENYHVSEAFKLMASEDCNILKNVPKETKKKIRRIAIDLVLATDMSRHADIMGALKNCISVGAMTGETYDSRLLMMKMAMKLADVSNPAKLPHVAKEWTKRVTDEFYSQGDREKEKGLSISPFMDREIQMTSKAQIGFITFVVQPLAELWNTAMGSGLECLENLALNLEFWKKKLDEEDTKQVATATTTTKEEDSPTIVVPIQATSSPVGPLSPTADAVSICIIEPDEESNG